jgi:hypothetical protein
MDEQKPPPSELPGALDLVPHLGVLDKLLREQTPDKSHGKIHRYTEQLAYYLRGACFALWQFENTRVHAAQQFVELIGDNPRGQWLVTGDVADVLGFTTDSFLTCLRRACDAIVHYLGRCPKTPGLPESFNDLVDGLRKNKYRVDEDITALVLAYWDQYGSKIKGYRDQASHKAVILSNPLMFYHHVAGSVGLKLNLPDDPNEKSPTELKYEPGVLAMSFLVDSLYHTIEFVNAVVERMIDLMAPGQADVRDTYVVSVAARGGPINLLEPAVRGEPVPFSVTMHEVVQRAVRDSMEQRKRRSSHDSQ